jgi:homoserine kinase
VSRPAGTPVRAVVRVPGSTSNLGAGFDCVGLAVDRWVDAEVSVEDGGSAGVAPVVTVRRGGELSALDAHGVAATDDLLYAGFAAACRARGRPLPARVAFGATSNIPVARGLGSSAAAVVAGARLADLSIGLRMTDDELAATCAGVEGHPDNVAPCVFGGAVLAVPTASPHSAGERAYAFAQLVVHESLAFAFAVPDFPLSTKAGRAALPAALPHAVATAAAAKSAALVRGLAAGDGALLAAALDDVLHVPYRRASVRGYDLVERAAVAAGAFGATLSGSGSTMVAIAPAERAVRVAAAMCEAWAAAGVRAEPLVVHGAVRPG